MSAHTPEPWTRQGYRIVAGGRLIADLNAETSAHGQRNSELALAHGDRLVAAVNGSAGLNPAAFTSAIELLPQLDPLINGWGTLTMTEETKQRVGKRIADVLALAHAEARP